MKTFLSFFFFVGALCSQTGQICWVPDKATPGKSACQDVTATQKAVLAAFIATQTVQTGTNADGSAILSPKYLGLADLIITSIKDGLFRPLMDNPTFQPAAIKTLQTAAVTAQSNLDAAKIAAIAKAPIADPQ